MTNKLKPILIPTEDASILYLNIHSQLQTGALAKYPFNHHLYLVSDAPIKIGDVVVEKLITGKEMLITIHNLNDIDIKTQRKIEFTTDPKLIADGVPAIDGNTKAYKYISDPDIKRKEVNFLTELCKRWNDKEDMVIKYNNNILTFNK